MSDTDDGVSVRFRVDCVQIDEEDVIIREFASGIKPEMRYVAGRVGRINPTSLLFTWGSSMLQDAWRSRRVASENLASR
jgi:hypothetical protein